MLALTTALVAPYFIDWSKYKQDFEREASRIIGHQVTVGSVEQLRLLPAPSVTFADFSVGQTDEGEPIIEAESFSLVAELMPFLRGEVRLLHLDILTPIVRIDIDENGGLRWNETAKPLVPLNQVNLDQMTVEDGLIIVARANNPQPTEIRILNANMQADTLLGPWVVEGTGMVGGKTINYTASTGTVQNDGSMRAQIGVARDDLPYRLVVDGPVSTAQGQLQWVGKYQVKKLFGDELKLSGKKPLPIFMEGNFQVTAKAVTVPAYRVEIGTGADPYVVQGIGQISLDSQPRFKVQVDGNQLDLKRLENSTSEKSEQVAVTMRERLASMKALLSEIPIPQIEGEFDVILPAIVAGDTLIREVKAKVLPQQYSWRVSNLSAKFPGNTQLEAKGRVGISNNFGFSGNLLMATKQPSGFAAWASGEVDPAIRRLRSAGFSANVTFTQNQFSFDGLELVLDEAKLGGRIQRLTGKDGRPAIVAQLEGDKIDLDDLRAIYAVSTGSNGAINGHDFDISLRAEAISGKIASFPIDAKEVNSRLRVENGELSIEQLNVGDFHNVAITSTGRIANVLSRPNGNIKLNMKSANLANFASFIGQNLYETPIFDAFEAQAELSEDTDLSLEMDSTSLENGSKGQALISGAIGGTKVVARIGFDGAFNKLSAIKLDSNMTFANPSPQILIRQTGIDIKSVPSKGPLSASLELVGTANEGLSTLISLNAPESNLSANGLVKLDEKDQFSSDFKLTLGSQDLSQFVKMAGERFDELVGREPLAVSGSLDVEHSVSGLQLVQIKGQLNGQKIGGDLKVDLPNNGNPKWSGGLKFDQLDAGLLWKAILGGAKDTSQQSNVSRFQRSAFLGHDGVLNIEADSFQFDNVAKGDSFSAKLNLLNGQLNLNNVSANWLGGSLNGNVSLQNNEGVGLIQLQYQLANADLGQLQGQIGLPNQVNGKFNSNGTLDGTGRSSDGLFKNLKGSGLLSIESGTITGIDPDALPQMLLAADVEGFDLQSESLTSLVDDNALKAEAKFENVNQTYTVSNGAVQFRNLLTKSDGMEISASGQYEFLKPNIKSEIRFSYDAGNNAVAGAVPEFALRFEGTPKSLKRNIDTKGLEGYFSIRSFEREQRRVEILQSGILEKQRHRRSILYTNARITHKARLEKKALERELELEKEANSLLNVPEIPQSETIDSNL